MPARALLDANAAIALFEGPSDGLHDRALELFRRVSNGELEVTVTAPVLVELAWYLEQQLGWPRGRCARRLRQFLDADGIVSGDRLLEATLDVYARHRRLDFVDAYLAACAAAGPPAIASFDRDFDRVAGLSRVGG